MASKKIVFSDTDSGGVIQVANIKGGVGKSTIATNLAACLSDRGSTLLIDFDVQGSATSALGENPSDHNFSSFDLLTRKYYEASVFKSHSNNANKSAALHKRVRGSIRERIFSPKGEIDGVITNIHEDLDLVPANSSLFKDVTKTHLTNLLFNLEILKDQYKYVIVDTPSIWNELVKCVFCNCDINLIPVTLTALSTRSLKDYMVEVGRLINNYPEVQVRIIKNEVYGKSTSRNIGKTKTINENRDFLDSLFSSFNSLQSSRRFMPASSMVLNLEIPEASIIRDAQDQGVPVNKLKNYNTVKKSFNDLTDSIQFILNRKSVKTDSKLFKVYPRHVNRFKTILKVAIFLLVFFTSSKIYQNPTEKVVLPQLMERPNVAIIKHTFNDGFPFFRFAKYAIGQYRAIVPTPEIINKYITETIKIHNLTALENGQKYIKNLYRLPKNSTISFYPPSFIHNDDFKVDEKVYRYFESSIADTLPYLTGVWNERGTGGGSPHKGIDVAGELGSNIISLSNGIAKLSRNSKGGNMIQVLNDDYVLLYAHMDKRYFKNGQKIKKGDILGTIGMTGRTSGPHVHVGYGIERPGAPGRYIYADPKYWFFREDYYKKKSQKEIL